MRVVVKFLEEISKRPVLDVLSDIHKKQNVHGHKPPMREQIDTYLQAERDDGEAKSGSPAAALGHMLSDADLTAEPTFPRNQPGTK